MSDIEMDDSVKPANSHSALAGITDEAGNDLKIVRDNMPFGNPSRGETGTYFIAYANTFSTTRKKCWKICSSAILRAIMTGCWISVQRKQEPCSLFLR